jgi:hypothetical protein
VLFTDRERQLQARTVVFVGYNEPNRQLWETLDAQGRTTHLLGDVRGRNSILSAIHAGRDLGTRV